MGSSLQPRPYHTSLNYMDLETDLIPCLHPAHLSKSPPYNPQLVFMTIQKDEQDLSEKILLSKSQQNTAKPQQQSSQFGIPSLVVILLEVGFCSFIFSKNLCNTKATKITLRMVKKILSSREDCFRRGSFTPFMRNRIKICWVLVSFEVFK